MRTVHQIACRFQFLADTPFILAGTAIKLQGFELKMLCSKTWWAQAVRADVTAGAFDHIRDRVVIPSGTAYIHGTFTKNEWKPYDMPAEEEQERASREMVVQVTLLNHIPQVNQQGIPEIGKLLKPMMELVVDGSILHRPLPVGIS